MVQQLLEFPNELFGLLLALLVLLMLHASMQRHGIFCRFANLITTYRCASFHVVPLSLFAVFPNTDFNAIRSCNISISITIALLGATLSMRRSKNILVYPCAFNSTKQVIPASILLLFVLFPLQEIRT